MRKLNKDLWNETSVQEEGEGIFDKNKTVR